MRLNRFRIPAAIVGLVPATIAGFALIANANIEPARAADAMELYVNVPGDRSPFSPRQLRIAAWNNPGTVNLSSATNDQASFVRIRAGLWRFCDGSNLTPDQAGCINLGKGDHDLRRRGFNDKISSFAQLRMK